MLSSHRVLATNEAVLLRPVLGWTVTFAINSRLERTERWQFFHARNFDFKLRIFDLRIRGGEWECTIGKASIVRAFCRKRKRSTCDWLARAIPWWRFRSKSVHPISGRLPLGNVTYLRRSASIMNWWDVRPYADSVDKSSARRGMFASDKAWGTTHWRNGEPDDIIFALIKIIISD